MDGFEQALDEIAALGFKGFETFTAVVDTYGNKVSEFQDLIAQRGLELVTVYGGGPMNEAHRMDEMIARNVGLAKFLAAHGADRLVLGGGSRTQGSPSRDDLHNQAHFMNEIGSRCLDFGVLACYHPHYATTVEPDVRDRDHNALHRPPHTSISARTRRTCAKAAATSWQ